MFDSVLDHCVSRYLKQICVLHISFFVIIACLVIIASKVKIVLFSQESFFDYNTECDTRAKVGQ